MPALLSEPIQVLTHLTTGFDRRHTGITAEQFMLSRHNCSDCSSTLLRHIRLGKLYWRCSHCQQETPV